MNTMNNNPFKGQRIEFHILQPFPVTCLNRDDVGAPKTAETYALDPEMRERLATLNPQAIKNIVGRMLEAHGRGMWKADQNMIDELQEIYADLEDRLEGMADE